MKKRCLIILLLGLFFLTGCGSYGEKDLLKDFSKKIKGINAYQVEGNLSITNNDDTYHYDVLVAYKKDDNFRVSLTNQANNHEQIILKNETGVYVVTPSLNKSFKFQSDWPHNNSQIYLLHSILEDMENDDEKIFEETADGYTIISKVNYSNNANLVKQKVFFDKDANIIKVEVLNSDDIPEMVMEFTNIDLKPTFSDTYFELDDIIEDIELDENETMETNAINDIIYPLYIPTGTVLVDQEKVNKDNGERIILTFDGEKPFLLVEETSDLNEEFSVIPTYGEPYLLVDTVGALTSNSISWSSNGIDYYIVSDVMSQVELIEIASSISAIPTMK